jgi:hypothetical protein
MRGEGKLVRGMIDAVLKTLRQADVAALSANRSQAWEDLQEDLLLWHVAREVFDGIPTPWLSDAEFAAAMGANGGYVDDPVPGGLTIEQAGKPTRHLAPPAGAELRREGNCIEAVWPDGRTRELGRMYGPDEKAEAEKALAEGARKAADLPLHKFLRACNACGASSVTMKKCSACGVSPAWQHNGTWRSLCFFFTLLCGYGRLSSLYVIEAQLYTQHTQQYTQQQYVTRLFAYLHSFDAPLVIR